MSESDYYDKHKANAHKTGNFGGTSSQRLLTNDSFNKKQDEGEEDFPQLAQMRKEKRSPSDEQKR